MKLILKLLYLGTITNSFAYALIQSDSERLREEEGIVSSVLPLIVLGYIKEAAEYEASLSQRLHSLSTATEVPMAASRKRASSNQAKVARVAVPNEDEGLKGAAKAADPDEDKRLEKVARMIVSELGALMSDTIDVSVSLSEREIGEPYSESEGPSISSEYPVGLEPVGSLGPGDTENAKSVESSIANEVE